MKPAPGLKGRAWTAEDDDRLKSLIEASVSIHDIAAKMKRTIQGVKSRAHALGISTKQVWIGLNANGQRMRKDPFQGVDLSDLSADDRAVIDELRSTYQNDGKDALIRSLADLARSNSTLFMWLLGKVLD
jgi:hypothetical protein